MSRFAVSAFISAFLFTSLPSNALGFVPGRNIISFHSTLTSNLLHSALSEQKNANSEENIDKWTKDEVKQVGNLVADDEWLGLGMELSETIRLAVLEETKKNTREFLGKEDYAVGDFSKELDSRVKNEVAKLRNKEEYELGDLTLALDKIGKDLTCELTGKGDYEFGDLSNEIDSRVKSLVSDYCGKDEYEFGDLSAEISRRTEAGVQEFLGKENYEFGDISREITS